MTKTTTIKLGYEVGSGKEVTITPAHLVVTGMTQASGKTTTLQAIIKRGNFNAIVFRTKVGERSITEGTVVPPYYKDHFDWEYAVELLESSRKEKLKFERSWIIKYSKTANNLLEFKANIDLALAGAKLRELEKGVLLSLQAYLEKILPELQYAPLSKTLDLRDGINVMDLERFKEETQSLIIRSVLDEVLRNRKNTVVVLPECWRYLPESLGSPVKRPAEAFIRQGAANKNFLFLDSQDITGVAKSILKQVSVWIMGYQREVNEIRRTLDQLPLKKSQKPKPEDIATLQVGHFYVATSQFTIKVYVQPVWMDDNTAKQVSLGKIKVEEIDYGEAASKLPSAIKGPNYTLVGTPEVKDGRLEADLGRLKKELVEVRHDFFDKIQQIYSAINELREVIYRIEKAKPPVPVVNEDAIVSKVLQKIPLHTPQATSQLDREAIVQEVLARVPKVAGGVTYEVTPLENLKKGFQEEAKSRILETIATLDERDKKILRYVESRGVGVTYNDILTNGLGIRQSGGGTQQVREKARQMASKGILRIDDHARVYSNFKKSIMEQLSVHGATDQEAEQVYNHIVHEMIK